MTRKTSRKPENKESRKKEGKIERESKKSSFRVYSIDLNCLNLKEILKKKKKS